MKAVRRDIEKPPEGWRYTVPETRSLIKADFFEDLWKKVIKHREANNLPIPDDYREFLEDAACNETNPPGSRCGEAKPKPRANKPIQVLLLSHVERFLKTVWQAILDRKFVSREEARRRLDVCMECPLRTTMPGGCTGCYSLVKKAGDLVSGGLFSIREDFDGFKRDVCVACGCFVPLKVTLENATLNKAEGSERPAYWAECWRNDK
jgi:hypothetical protein